MRGAVLAFGDSLTAGYQSVGLPSHPYAARLRALLPAAPDWQVVEAGVSGETTAEMVERLPQQLQRVPGFDFVFILGGTNDLGSGETREQIATTICSLHKTAHAHGCRTLAISIPEHHMENRRQYLSMAEKRKGINDDLKRFAEAEEKTEFFDLAALLPYFGLSDPERRQIWDEDQLHFNARGYDRFGELLYERMSELGWVSAP